MLKVAYTKLRKARIFGDYCLEELKILNKKLNHKHTIRNIQFKNLEWRPFEYITKSHVEKNK
jgi:hypothetical protein